VGQYDLSAVIQREQRLIGPGSPYEVQQARIAGRSCSTYKHAPQSLNDLYRKAMAMGDTSLAIFAARRLSYRDAFSQAAQLMGILRNRYSVQAGSRVGIALDSRPEWVIAFFAITAMGATAVLLDERNVPSVVAGLKLSQCAVAIVGVEVAPTIRDELGSQLALIVVGSDSNPRRGLAGMGQLQELLAQSPPLSPAPGAFPSLLADSEAVIVFTSGTTGLPKGVIQTHRGVVTGLMNMGLAGLLANVSAREASTRNPRVRSAPCALTLLPLSYIGGYAQLLLMLTVGGTLVVCNRCDTAQIGRYLDTEQVRSMSGATPSQLLDLVDARPDPGTLASLALYGSVLHSQTVERIAARWPQVMVSTGYGLTETNGAIATIAGEMLGAMPAAAGRVVPTVEIRVLDGGGREVTAREVGEIYLRGACLMRGYCGEQRSHADMEDGWFRSGDLGTLSEDRVLTIIDRAQQSIDLDGKVMSVFTLERALVAELGVGEIVVLFDHREGAPPSITVVIARRKPEMQTRWVREKVAAVLEHAALDISVVDVAELPTNRAGKVDRRALRAAPVMLPTRTDTEGSWRHKP
jgi:long-chain acyl-CoA synthetase